MFKICSIARNPTFKVLSEKDVGFFNSITRVISDPEVLKQANCDWTKKFQGNSTLMLKPKTNEEVASILKYCNQEKIAVVP
jgi:D-lactate dehydrogenase (cytochrome)